MALTSLTTEYRVPKREISAEAMLLGHTQKVVRLFLNERAQARDGAERLSDLLNGDGEFLPAVEPPQKVVLLRKDALMLLTVAAETEFPPEEEDEGGLTGEAGNGARVEVTLQDGTEFAGVVSFVMPEGRNRLIDFLNLPSPFFALRDGAFARLVNKRCIVRICIVGHEPGR